MLALRLVKYWFCLHAGRTAPDVKQETDSGPKRKCVYPSHCWPGSTLNNFIFVAIAFMLLTLPESHVFHATRFIARSDFV